MWTKNEVYQRPAGRNSQVMPCPHEAQSAKAIHSDYLTVFMTNFAAAAKLVMRSYVTMVALARACYAESAFGFGFGFAFALRLVFGFGGTGRSACAIKS